MSEHWLISMVLLTVRVVIDRAHARSISIRKMLSTVRVRTVRYTVENVI